MKTIWKFPLELTDVQFIDLRGGEVLTVQMQGKTPCLWATVDTEAPAERERHIIHIIGTGKPFPNVSLRYLGSLQEHIFIWHVFEQVK